MQHDYAVETFDLTKSYGKITALDKLNIKIESNMIRVLLGPNGSGKTTFLHLISTVLRPTSGTAKVFGHDIMKEDIKVRELVGVSFQEPRGFWRHKPKHILSFHAAIHGIPSDKRKEKVERVMKEFGLWESRDKKFMDLSGGQAKRLEVAKLFIQKPKLAIFDEPTAMIDLDGKRFVWEKIRELKENGSTIIVATNEVREAEYLAEKISIFSRGKELISSSLPELKDLIKGSDKVELTFSDKVDEMLISEIKKIPSTFNVKAVSSNVILANVTKSEEWVPAFVQILQKNKARLLSIKVSEPSLDEVFMKIVGEVK